MLILMIVFLRLLRIVGHEYWFVQCNGIHCHIFCSCCVHYIDFDEGGRYKIAQGYVRCQRS